MRNLLLILLLFFGLTPIISQNDNIDLNQVITLDSFVVTASRSGFSVEEFIDIVENDKSFYEAFRNLRFSTYTFTNNIIAFNKTKKKTIATYNSTAIQTSIDSCRTMEMLESTSTGNFYKKKNQYRYYTARLYDRVFYTHGKICETRSPIIYEPETKMAKHIAELKKLIFNPGKKVDVPIIGDKTAIFSKKMAKYYDYRITSEMNRNGTDCYVFIVSLKPDYIEKKQSKTIVKYLETYFDKNTFQVIGRKYQLKYSGVLFDFDVKMEIELTKLGGLYFPETIHYEGFWDVPFKKAEYVDFEAQFYDFE